MYAHAQIKYIATDRAQDYIIHYTRGSCRDIGRGIIKNRCGSRVQGPQLPADLYYNARATPAKSVVPPGPRITYKNPSSPFLIERSFVYYLWNSLKVLRTTRPSIFSAAAVAGAAIAAGACRCIIWVHPPTNPRQRCDITYIIWIAVWFL